MSRSYVRVCGLLLQMLLILQNHLSSESPTRNQTTTVVEVVTDPVALGEGPHWCHEEQALYFVSLLDASIHKYVPETGEHTWAYLKENPSFIIPIEGRRHNFAVGQGSRVEEFEWSGEGEAKFIKVLAEVDHDSPTNSFNDAKADPRGRLFAGTMSTDNAKDGKLRKGFLYRIDPDGTAHELDSNIGISNGLCFDVNEGAFYFVDSLDYTIRRYDYDVETGDISNPRHVFKFSDYNLPGIADGMTIDTEGNLWLANFDGSQVLKIDPRTGTLLEGIPIPAALVASVTFGGPDFSDLYVTSAAMDPEHLPPAGSTFRITGLGVKGYQNDYAIFH